MKEEVSSRALHVNDRARRADIREGTAGIYIYMWTWIWTWNCCWPPPAHNYRRYSASWGTPAQVLNANLANPDKVCGAVEVGGIWRSHAATCQWPWRCCSTYRPAHTLTEFGSPLSRATTTPSTPNSRSTLSSTEAGMPPGALQDDHDVWEVAPPTPGAHVTRDPEHPYMPTPVRANQVTTTTPADSAKKAGDNDDHPINLN